VKRYRKRFFVKRARSLNWKRRGHGSVTANQLRDLWRKQRGKCAMTGLKLSRTCCHVDHIVPIKRGGKNLIENMRWVHPFPNLVKGAKLDSEVQLGPGEEFPF
jgi:5-methylcytosine-specific restriction endonuclease McrA